MSKLAIDHLEHNGRQFRLAVDFSIWSFEVQSGQGGLNPAIRTLFHRLLRLLSSSIRPLIVFDGPLRPVIKRNARLEPNSSHWEFQSQENDVIKDLLTGLGIPYHDAPGEAEAECAVLQRHGVVDAVLTEDVDAIMFGCKMTLKNWSNNQSGGNLPTHVDLYDSEAAEKTSGLDREGLVLVALLSGGDYDTHGISRCGFKTACEAARAGFGRELCIVSKKDQKGFDAWKERLQHEFNTNESRFFKRKHKAIILPQDFPDLEILGYYQNPVVSSPDVIDKIRDEIQWEASIKVFALREFVKGNFGWTTIKGAHRLIHRLAPSLLLQRLLQRHCGAGSQSISNSMKLENEELQFISAITRRRNHQSVDGHPELRVSYVPGLVVGIDLSKEKHVEQAKTSELGKTEVIVIDSSSSTETGHQSEDLEARGKKRAYDPFKPTRIWVPETFVKLGAPSIAESWEDILESQANRERRPVPRPDPQQGAIERYLKTTKPVVFMQSPIHTKDIIPQSSATSPTRNSEPPVLKACSKSILPKPLQEKTVHSTNSEAGRPKYKRKPASKKEILHVEKNINPWTLARQKAG